MATILVANKMENCKIDNFTEKIDLCHINFKLKKLVFNYFHPQALKLLNKNCVV